MAQLKLKKTVSATRRSSLSTRNERIRRKSSISKAQQMKTSRSRVLAGSKLGKIIKG